MSLCLRITQYASPIDRELLLVYFVFHIERIFFCLPFRQREKLSKIGCTFEIIFPKNKTSNQMAKQKQSIDTQQRDCDLCMSQMKREIIINSIHFYANKMDFFLLLKKKNNEKRQTTEKSY